jgi:F420-non-reducing hydrogenase iron-sulfur subunit
MKPQIVIYCCANSTLVPEEHVEKLVAEGQAEIKIARLPCSGRTDVLYLLRAIEEGATMAMVVGCPEGQCQFLEGNLRAKMRVRYANRLLAEAGLGNERIRMVNIDPGDDQAFAAALRDTVAKARELGPWLIVKS